jgi:arylsulfatase A-like enzyme
MLIFYRNEKINKLLISSPAITLHQASRGVKEGYVMSRIKNVRPNIVILVPDEMRGDMVNNPDVSTPNIDKLREDSITFTNNFSVNPVCAPSRCCTFTGQYPHNGAHRSLYQVLRKNDENLFRILKNNGYEVHWIGRNDLFYSEAAKESVTKVIKPRSIIFRRIIRDLSMIDRLKLLREYRKISKNGFNMSVHLLELLSKYLQMNPYPLEHKLRKSYYYGKKTRKQSEFDYDSIVTEKALEYIDKKGKARKYKPFCLYLAYAAPHPPYGVDEPFFSLHDREKITPPVPPELEDKPEFMKIIHERYRLKDLNEADFKEIRATYYGMISKLDSQIGQLLDRLKENDIYDNALILLFSDHGDYAGDYGLTEKWVNAMHDCLLKVPLIVKMPETTVKSGRIDNRGKIIDGLTQSIDIFPTVLEITGIETQYTHFGKSLVPIINGKAKGREIVFAQGGYNPREPQCFEDVFDSPEDPLLGIYHDKTTIQQEKPETVERTTMIRTKEWKLVLRNKTLNELYNMIDDPVEQYNLINDKQQVEIITSLKNKLLEWYLETSDNPYHGHDRPLN